MNSMHNDNNTVADTEQKLLAYSNMLDVTIDCIKIIDLEGCIVYMNRAGHEALLKAKPPTKLGMKWLSLLPAEVRGAAQQAINRAKKGKTARFAGKSGEGHDLTYWDNVLTPILDEQNQIHQIICISRDVSLIKSAEHKLAMMSELDDLTGLYNRRVFKEYITKNLKLCKKRASQTGLMLLNIDQFKLVNGNLGNDAGDHFLKIIAGRLSHPRDKRITIGRVGGDEFAIIVDNIKSVEELEQLASNILKKMEKPVIYAGKYINNSVSIGCAIYPAHSSSPAELMKAAGSALTYLKATKRGGFRIYNDKIATLIMDRANQLDTCRNIIKDDAIRPYYQPQVNLETKEIIGYEALLRWFDQDHQLCFPSCILEAFSHYELACKIGEIMQHKVLQDIQRWIQQARKVVPISINAAPVEFLNDDYAERLLERLKQYNVSGSLISIEITEHFLTDNGVEHVLRALNLLKKNGIRVAIDDFGTGYSSFVRLRDYPVDCLKLDSSFTQSIGDDGKNLSIVKAIIDLGPSLSLKIIAEGVETEQQRQQLLEIGCRYGQGFLFSRAISAEQIYGYS